MAEDTIRKQVSREIKRALSDARLSAREAARRMGVEPKTLYRWINEDNDATLENLVLFAKHVGPIRLDVGPTDATKEPSPKWAGAMEQRLTEALVASQKVFVDTMATYFAELGIERALDDSLPIEPAPETRESLPGQAEPK